MLIRNLYQIIVPIAIFDLLTLLSCSGMARSIHFNHRAKCSGAHWSSLYFSLVILAPIDISISLCLMISYSSGCRTLVSFHLRFR